MVNVSQAPDLRKYEDYRKYLRDYADFRRDKNPRWSYSLWARRLGFRNKSPLLMVVNGHRKASGQLVNRLVTYFGFSKTEESYFRILVMNADRGKSVRAQEIRYSTESSENLPPIDDPLLTTWLAFVVKETATALGKETQSALSKALLQNHPPEQLAQILSALLSAGLLEPNPTDPEKFQLSAKSPHIQWTAEATRKLHLDCLDASRRAFEELAPEERSFRVSFLKIKKERLPEASILLKRFQKELTDHFEDASGDEVFQINLQLFPVTRGLKS